MDEGGGDMDKNRMNQEFIDDIKAMFPPERVRLEKKSVRTTGTMNWGMYFQCLRFS